MVAPARGRDLRCHRAGGVVHRGERAGLSRFPKLWLTRRAIVPPYHRALAAGAADDSRCCADLEKESRKEELIARVLRWAGKCVAARLVPFCRAREK